jgi:nucleotide-binding universal stress UspA family protein
MMSRILLPLEWADDGTGAVDFAQTLAQRCHGELLLLRIGEWPILAPLGFAWAPSFQEAELDRLKSRLESREGVRTKILSSETVPSPAILEQARNRAASLILMTYRQQRVFSRVLYGNAADRVLQYSPIPVLAIPTSLPVPPSDVTRIIYSYDGGDATIPGLRDVIDFAQVFEATVYLHRFRVPPGPEGRFLPSQLIHEKEEPSSDKDAAESLEESLLSILKRREVPARVLPESQDHVRDLLSAISRHAIDLVVLSKREDSDKACTALARRVLQAAEVPLLLSCRARQPSSMNGAGSPVRVGI